MDDTRELKGSSLNVDNFFCVAKIIQKSGRCFFSRSGHSDHLRVSPLGTLLASE